MSSPLHSPAGPSVSERQNGQSHRAPLDTQQASQLLKDAIAGVQRVIVGQEQMVEQLMVGLLAKGHCLLEGVPGVAKTLAVRSFATVVGGDFARIQFTPDLVPSDIVGTRIYKASQETFDVELGPVFVNFVLADDHPLDAGDGVLEQPGRLLVRQRRLVALAVLALGHLSLLTVGRTAHALLLWVSRGPAVLGGRGRRPAHSRRPAQPSPGPAQRPEVLRWRIHFPDAATRGATARTRSCRVI